MNQLMINIVIAFVWTFLQDAPSTQHFVIGYTMGAIFLYFSSRRSKSMFYLHRVAVLLQLVVVFLVELVRSNAQVAYQVLHPRLPVKPGLIAVPLAATTDAQITIFAAMITMTPGTISVDVSPDKRYLYVHVLSLDDAEVTKSVLKDRFERRIVEVLS